MNSENIVNLAELGLKGDKIALTAFIQELAAESANKNKNKLYHGLLEVLESNSSPRVVNISATQKISVKTAPDELWFSKNMKRRIKRMLSMIASNDLPPRYRGKFNKLLLYGPPGSGKTTIGHYIASQLHKPIEYVKISDVISFKFGETLKNLAIAFEKNEEAVIFIDEFDAFAKSRFDSNDVGELKRIVNSLIQTLDVLAGERIVIVATNLKDEIDPAILRRFPIKLHVPELNKAERSELIDFMKLKSDTLISLSSRENAALEDTLVALGLKTVDSIKSLFDATSLHAYITKVGSIKFIDILETMLTDGMLDGKAAKKIQDANPQLMGLVLDTLKKRYSKIEIADLMGVHRNSINNYG